MGYYLMTLPRGETVGSAMETANGGAIRLQWPGQNRTLWTRLWMMKTLKNGIDIADIVWVFKFVLIKFVKFALRSKLIFVFFCQIGFF
jgi:hypothetical protein